MGKLKVKNITLGDNIDTTKNIVLKVPNVADGTLTIETEAGTDLVTIATDGRISFPATPKVSGSMGRSANNSMTANVLDDSQFDLVNWQVGSSFAGSPTYGFTAPRAGQYLVDVKGYVTAASGMTNGYIQIFIDGVGAGFSGGPAASGTVQYFNYSSVIQLTAGQVVTVKMYAATGTTVILNGPNLGTTFSVVEL